MNANVAIYQSSIEFESRILKETNSITKLGLVSKVYILGIWRNHLPLRENITNQCTIIRLRCASAIGPKQVILKSLKIIEFSLKVIIFCEKIKPSSVTIHSSSLLLLGLFLKIRHKAKIIYAPHELESERIGLSEYQKILIKKLEKTVLPFADSISAPSFPIAKWYSETYKIIPPFLIYNAPCYKRQKSSPPYYKIRDIFNIPKKSILFLYHGLLDEGRGIEIICKCFQDSKRGFHILFCGFGDLAETIKEYQAKCPAIHLMDPVAPNMILNIARQADVGICLIENTCLSYQFSLPNKLFEYMHAGLAVISSNFPTMRQIVTQARIGWSIKPSTKSLSSLLQKIPPKTLQSMKKNSCKARKEYCWENNEKNILKMYNL